MGFEPTTPTLARLCSFPVNVDLEGLLSSQGDPGDLITSPE